MDMVKSVRTFIGSRNFEESRSFYREWGFKEYRIGPTMSYFETGPQLGFYLQDYKVKDWIDNTMMFLEVEDLDAYWEYITTKNLADKFGIKIKPIQNERWGREFFVYDPAGILWHIGTFY